MGLLYKVTLFNSSMRWFIETFDLTLYVLIVPGEYEKDTLRQNRTPSVCKWVADILIRKWTLLNNNNNYINNFPLSSCC